MCMPGFRVYGFGFRVICLYIIYIYICMYAYVELYMCVYYTFRSTIYIAVPFYDTGLEHIAIQLLRHVLLFFSVFIVIK